MSFAMLYVTFDKEDDAQELTTQLLEKKLIAGANIIPANSSYWWKGQINQSGEFIAIMQTSIHIWEKVESTIEELHPYEVPCIIRLEVASNEAYEKWVEDTVMDKS